MFCSSPVRAFALVALCATAVVLAGTGAAYHRFASGVPQAGALGSPITFRVYVCGFNDDFEVTRLPFDVCRAKLVGCPTGNGGEGNCLTWPYTEGIEMTPNENFVSPYCTV